MRKLRALRLREAMFDYLFQPSCKIVGMRVGFFAMQSTGKAIGDPLYLRLRIGLQDSLMLALARERR